MLVDGIAVGIVSVAIALFADRLVFMSVLVPCVFVARIVGWRLWAVRESGRLLPELLFLLLCTALGAFNDWNSVFRHQIYHYDVPVFFPELSTLPLWMLLFWGLILRLMATLVSWEGVGVDGRPRRGLRLPGGAGSSGAVVVLFELALVLVTRQAIYRLYADPVLSWLPFAVAIALHAALFEWDRNDVKLVFIAVFGGWAIETLYIQVGGLHHYQHDWFTGVPLWILLWWILAVLIWRDLVVRIRLLLQRASPAART